MSNERRITTSRHLLELALNAMENVGSVDPENTTVEELEQLTDAAYRIYSNARELVNALEEAEREGAE